MPRRSHPYYLHEHAQHLVLIPKPARNAYVQWSIDNRDVLSRASAERLDVYLDAEEAENEAIRAWFKVAREELDTWGVIKTTKLFGRTVNRDTSRVKGEEDDTTMSKALTAVWRSGRHGCTSIEAGGGLSLTGIGGALSKMHRAGCIAQAAKLR